MNDSKRIKQIALSGVLVALLVVCSWISIPIPLSPVPITLQTLVVMLIGGLLTPKNAFFTLSVYILMGLCGLQVFAGMSGGYAVLFGPTGGFIFGFLIVGFLLSITYTYLPALRTKSKFYLSIIPLILFAVILQYIIGGVWMAIHYDMTFIATVKALIPFLFGDCLKVISATTLIPILNAVLNDEESLEDKYILTNEKVA